MTKEELESLAGEFCGLFISNNRTIGQFHPKSGRIETVTKEMSIEDWVTHFNGVAGVGGVPIMDDNNCHWAVIDIDNHGQEEDTPIGPIDKIVTANQLPLVVCRSKSGGVHAYAFFKDAQPAAKVRAMMAKWAVQIGHPGVEVYPKQSTLRRNPQTGTMQNGNLVNLPYFVLAKTNRYAFRSEQVLDARGFLDLAIKLRMSNADVKDWSMKEHQEAPPCVQRMLTEGVEAGSRNEAAFHIGVYLRKAYPAEVEARLRDINNTIFPSPLPRAELTRTILSAQRPDYNYRCSVDPQNSLCDRTTCLTRKHGITISDAEAADIAGQLPEFTNLTKFMSEPIRWEMTVDGKLITNISTAQLLEWRFVREMIAEKLTKIVPMIKNGEWERILSKAMETVRVIDTPDDASINGVVRARLRDFSARTDLMSHGSDTKDREAMLRGLPCVQIYDGERQVMFRSQDFVAYLKRTRSEELKGVALWFAVRDVGVRHSKVRVGTHSVNVWMLPVSEVQKEVSEAAPVEFTTDL